MSAKPTVFIDGEAGTTGLEIRKHLAGHSDVEMISIAADKRKDILERRRLLNECDLAVLCLPDEAARDAVELIENPAVRILDASTAHRVAPRWTYGFPELTLDQEECIRHSHRVSNPGCYATGAVAMLRPLVDAGVIPAHGGVTVHAISGYSGGGKELISICEHPDGSDRSAAFCLYGLEQNHKHLPEMRVYSGLAEEPIFLPSYSRAFYRGMLVTVALSMKRLNGLTGKQFSVADVREILAARYDGMKNILVEPIQEHLDKGYVLTPTSQNETNNVQLRVFANPDKETVIVTAVLDNLGKGASSAAVQNIEIMLGVQRLAKDSEIHNFGRQNA